RGEGGGDRAWHSARGEFFAAGAPWSGAPPDDFVGSAANSSFAFWSEWLAETTRTLEWSGGVSSWQWIGPVSEERWESGPIPLEGVQLPPAGGESFRGALPGRARPRLARAPYGAR